MSRPDRPLTTADFRRYVRAATVGFLILFVGILIALGVSSRYNTGNDRESAANRRAIVISGRVVSVAGCNRDFKSISSLRSLLLRAQVSTAIQHKSGVLSDAQYQRALDYYQKSLGDIRLPDCREAAKVVTDDPRQLRDIPTPLYPGGPGDPEAQRPNDPKPNG